MKTDQYIEQAIVQLLSLQIRSGRSLSDVKALLRRCLREASLTAKLRPRPRGLDIHRLGSVLRTWHKETRYLTFDGLPRPLTTEGRTGLRTLVKRFYPNEAFEVVFDRLIDAKLIRSCGDGQWVPSGQTARISQLSLETLEHLAEGILRYVETVTRNVTTKKEQELLFERSAKVTSLPATEIEAFRKHVNQQALVFIIAIDDWLESRSAKSKRPKTRQCTAGVYTFAYIAPGKQARSGAKAHRPS